MLDPSSNILPFREATDISADAFDRTLAHGIGSPVLCLQKLIDAVLDARLDRAQLAVLAVLIKRINRLSGAAYPSRQTIADETGQSLKSTVNRLYELKGFGYIEWKRRPTQSDGRKLLHYSLKLDCQAHLNSADLKSTRRGGYTRPVGRNTTRPGGQKSTRPGGRSNLLIGTKDFSTSSDEVLEISFLRFWDVFPRGRKQAKGAARNAFCKIVRRGAVTAEDLIAGAERYAGTRPDPKYTPMPSTWLHQSRWEDDACRKPALPIGPDNDATSELDRDLALARREDGS